MSLRLAVKRSLDEAERDELEVRDIQQQLELLHDIELAQLKQHVHPVRKTPFIDLPAPVGSVKRAQRIDVALLLESLTHYLLAPLVASPGPKIAGQEAELTNALRIFGMVVRLGKKEVLELEDFVDATSDAVVDIAFGYILYAFTSLIEDVGDAGGAGDVDLLSVGDPSDRSEVAPKHELLALLYQAFDVLSFFARTELDMHSHALTFTRALGEHPNASTFISVTIDTLSFLAEQDDAIGASSSLIPDLMFTILDLIDSFLYVDIVAARLLESPVLVGDLLDIFLFLFQDNSQPDDSIVLTVRMLLRLVEDGDFVHMVAQDQLADRFRQALLVLETILSQSLEGARDLVELRVAGLQVFVAVNDLGIFGDTFHAGEVALVISYLSGPPTEFIAMWKSSEFEHICVLRLLASLFALIADKREAKTDFLNRIVGPKKGKTALIQRATTSYHPSNVIDNVSFLLYETVSNPKLRKLISHPEGLSVSRFREELEGALGVRRRLSEEMEHQLQRFLQMRSGYRASHWSDLSIARAGHRRVQLRRQEKKKRGRASLDEQRTGPPTAEALLLALKVEQSRAGANEEEEEDKMEVDGSQADSSDEKEDKEEFEELDLEPSPKPQPKVLARGPSSASSSGLPSPQLTTLGPSTIQTTHFVEDDVDVEGDEEDAVQADMQVEEKGEEDEELDMDWSSSGPLDLEEDKKPEATPNVPSHLPVIKEEEEKETRMEKDGQERIEVEKPAEAAEVKEEMEKKLAEGDARHEREEEEADEEGRYESKEKRPEILSRKLMVIEPPLNLEAPSSDSDLKHHSGSDSRPESRFDSELEDELSSGSEALAPRPAARILDVAAQTARPVPSLAIADEPIDPFGLASSADEDKADESASLDVEEDADYSSDSRSGRKSRRKRGPPPRRGIKRKAEDPLLNTSPAKRQRTPDRAEPLPSAVSVPRGSPSRSGVHLERRDKEQTESAVFEGLVFRISKQIDSAETIADQVVRHGGVVLQYTTKHTTHFVATQEEYNEFGPPIQAAVKRRLPIVSRAFVLDSVRERRRLPETAYLLGERPGL